MLPEGRISDLRPVLVIEDCDDDFDTVVVAATRANVANRLVRAASAEEAGGILARSPSGSFSFVLLDYNLPGMNGLDFLESARRDRLLVDLPTVVLTTSVNPSDRVLFQAAGATAFHVKSVAHTDCLQTLASIFDRWLNQALRPNDVEAPVAVRRLT